MTFSISKTIKNTAPLSIPREGRVFEKIAKSVLGANYDVSVVLVGDQKSHTLNMRYRKKDKPTNVLAFPLSKNSGEIYINIPLAIKEAAKFESTTKKHICYLFVHGLLHLKGFDHGEKMEKEEARLMKKFTEK